MLKKTVISWVLLCLSAVSSQALPISMRTKVSCLSDYYRFCNDWPQEELRRCFQMNVLKVSNICISALVDEGLVSKTEVDNMKKQALALQTAKPIIKSTMPPPINPNPTIEEIKKRQTVAMVPVKNETKKKEEPKAKPAPIPKKSGEFDRWKRQNGFN